VKLRDWLDRLTIAARSACCDFAPREIADLVAAIREAVGNGDDTAALRVGRLERLIKGAEQGSGGLCPWCCAWVAHERAHKPTCDAFHVDGALR
jgi:hypothetical protein